MGTFSIISTSVVKNYKTDGDGFVANGSFEVMDGNLFKLKGVVYDEDFMRTYLGAFYGEFVDGKMQYKTKGNATRVREAIGAIEGYVNNLYINNNK